MGTNPSQYFVSSSNFVAWVRIAKLLFLISLLYLAEYKLSTEITCHIDAFGKEICNHF